MAGPGDEVAAGGHGGLRASHADRERVIDRLKTAFVQGRLDKDEFDRRVGRALGSRTCAELTAVTADLPAAQPPAQPPEPVLAHGDQPVPRSGLVIAVATALYAGVWAIVLPIGPSVAVLVLTITSLLYYMIVVLIALGHMSASPQDRRPGGQSPQGPASGAGRQASRPLPSGADAWQA